MKTIVIVGCLLFAAFFSQNIKAQSVLDTQGNQIVIIGAFANQDNASKFTKQAKIAKLQPKVELNKLKNLYYVYVMQTNSLEAARAESTRLRETTPFKDSWVFHGPPIPPPPIVGVKPKEEVIEVVAKEEKPKKISKEDSIRLAHEKIKAAVDANVMSTKKGDMAKLENIFFYRDAGVLRPESHYAVDKLVTMLKENPKVKIRIHGGNDPGKIIKRASDTADFFSLKGTIESYGSAKELSELRADVIRDYLVAQGIDKKRMSIKAWGGNKPLFNVDDEKAEANVRVEIEVVQSEE